MAWKSTISTNEGLHRKQKVLLISKLDDVPQFFQRLL